MLFSHCALLIICIFSHLAWKNLARTNQGSGGQGVACKEQLLTLRNGARRLTDNPPRPIFHNFKSRLRCRNWHNIYTRSSRDPRVKQHAFTHLPFVLAERGAASVPPFFSPARRAPRLRADCLHCAHFLGRISPLFLKMTNNTCSRPRSPAALWSGVENARTAGRPELCEESLPSTTVQ